MHRDWIRHNADSIWNDQEIYELLFFFVHLQPLDSLKTLGSVEVSGYAIKRWLCGIGLDE